MSNSSAILIAAAVVGLGGLGLYMWRRNSAPGTTPRNDAAGPRLPSMPAMPRLPSMPAMPRMPSMPSMPNMGSGAAPNAPQLSVGGPNGWF